MLHGEYCIILNKTYMNGGYWVYTRNITLMFIENETFFFFKRYIMITIKYFYIQFNEYKF